MRIEIYGKQGCELCKSAQKKVAHFLQQWQAASEVSMVFMDVETEQGAAESDYFDVFQIPTVLVLKDDGHLAARWDGEAPPSQELKRVVSPETQSAAA